jgi:uncharacterized protein YndB with AHSA1/START domain
MNKIIHRKTLLDCTTGEAFRFLTDNSLLEQWLAVKADVEPEVSGKYELFWNPEDREYDSTIGCKITGIEENKFLSFEWKGPKQYSSFMNSAEPLTHIVVFFLPVDENTKTEMHLIHSGWRRSPEWNEAREWFEKMWEFSFAELNNLINGKKDE